MNSEEIEVKPTEVKFTKTSVFLLPILSILCIVLGICFFVVKDFKVDLNTFVIWLFFAVSMFYAIIAIIDVITRKDKEKLKYIIIMASITILATIFYILAFYLS